MFRTFLVMSDFGFRVILASNNELRSVPSSSFLEEFVNNLYLNFCKMLVKFNSKSSGSFHCGKFSIPNSITLFVTVLL